MKGHGIPDKTRRLYEYTMVTQDANSREKLRLEYKEMHWIIFESLMQTWSYLKQNKNEYN